ncbi:HNH endonuclease [Halosimplex sp. TS25]|uniref:HNH endonuclease n=1 Tax=Halosimplex rarum TaxID=3396619 RepID=UPI0039ECA595
MSLDSLELAYYRLFLSPESDAKVAELDHAPQAQTHIEQVLDAHIEISERYRTELQLRLAVHLSPPEAIEYDPMGRHSRATLIEEYMTETLGFDADHPDVHPIAQRVATLLDHWESGSSGGTDWQKDELLREQGGRCAHCHAPLDDVPVTLTRDDPYKPYGNGIGHRTEVDHIEAASMFGTDDLDNLQATCQLCNRGKNNDLTIPAETEFEYAPNPINAVPAFYRARMVYHVIKQGKRECARCGGREHELTIRPVNNNGPYVRSNMEPVCVSCLGWLNATAR